MTRQSLTTLALLAVLASPVLAQAPAAKGGAQSANIDAGWSAELEQHFAGIKLTTEQKAKIIASQQSRHAAMDKLNATDKDALATKAAVHAQMDAEHADFKAILSADDYKIFQTNMGKMMMSGNGMKDMPGMQGMDHDMKDMKGMKGMKADSAPKKP
jgi:hypothetical protein